MQPKQQSPQHTDSELRERLTDIQYRVTQLGETEMAFSGAYNKHYQPGLYLCVICSNELFTSQHKFDSGSGWPSFYEVIDHSKITTRQDTSHGMVRVEISCANCQAHLGHVFTDGPAPSGKRYCINSAALNFDPQEL